MEKKFIVAEKSETVDVERSVVGWGSKPSPDRDGELIEATAWDLENFRKNPVLCLSHDLSKPPIGKILWVKADANGLKFKAQFAGTERGKEAYQLYKEGIMNSFSVGFRPKPGGCIDNPMMDEKYKGMNLKRVFKSVELFEISCVTVPSLPSAVVEYVKSGKVQNTELKKEFEDVIQEIPADDPTETMETKAVGETTEQVTESVNQEEKKDDTLSLTAMATMLADLQKKYDNLQMKISSQEEKTMDNVTGQPSMYDIMNAVNKAVRKVNSVVTNNESTFPNEVIVASAYVVDLYPTTYPDGFVVYRVQEGDSHKTYRCGYVYDPITAMATLNDDVAPVQEAWVAKRYELHDGVVSEFSKDVDDTDMETKAGKVISSANVLLLEDVMTTLMDAIDTIQEVLDASTPKEKDKKSGVGVSADSEKTTEKSAADTHVDTDDELQFEGFDVQNDEIDIKEEELSNIITKAVGSFHKKLQETMLDSTVEQVSKLIGKATI